MMLIAVLIMGIVSGLLAASAALLAGYSAPAALLVYVGTGSAFLLLALLSNSSLVQSRHSALSEFQP